MFCQDKNALILPWDGCLGDCVSPCDWQEIRSAWRQHSGLCDCTSELRGHGTKVCLIVLKEENWHAGLWLMVASDWCSLHVALQWALSRPLPIFNRTKADMGWMDVKPQWVSDPFCWVKYYDIYFMVLWFIMNYIPSNQIKATGPVCIYVSFIYLNDKFLWLYVMLRVKSVWICNQ